MKEPTPALIRRIAWASKWAGREGRPSGRRVEVSPEARIAIQEFAGAIQRLSDPDAIQNAAFEAVKKNGLKPKDFFPVVYSILLGSDRGPRLGPYVVDSGSAVVSRSLLDGLAS